MGKLIEREKEIIRTITEEEKAILKIMLDEKHYTFEEIIEKTGLKFETVSFTLDRLVGKKLIIEDAVKN